jgi:hypothetical protein
MDKVFLCHTLLKSLSPEVYGVWRKLFNMSDGVFDKLASSSQKYHRRSDGSNPTIAQHTEPMVAAAAKVVGMLGEDRRTHEAVILGVAIHDIKKYGLDNSSEHTVSDHGAIAADWLSANASLFSDVFTVEQFEILLACVRYHSGIWSTDSLGATYQKYFKYIQFVHMLDMLESRDMLRY